MTSEKPRFERSVALEVAKELCVALKPACSRLIVAGSLRRQKPTVGDVEILFIPRFERRQADMFSCESISLAEETIVELLEKGTLSKRASKTGTFSWGPNNKLATHSSTGMPVDLFTATEENWWNYVVCRTGPSASNIRIASEAKKRGWKWTPYGSGFRRHGETHKVSSEAEVFTFVGLPYYEPWER